MKSFIKCLFASILGIIIASLILFLISFAVISSMVSRQERPVDVKQHSILMLKLDKPVVDRKTNMPVLTVDLDNLGIGGELGLNDLLNTIDKARTDTNITGIYLELSTLQAGIATIEEIRDALLEFRTSGKFIVAFSDTYSQGAYYLASLADKLYLNPAGYINFIGLSAEVMFYKQALDKLDIEAEIIRHGTFKSAVEPFLYDRMSPENREQIRVYVNSIWDHVVGQISESRGIQADRLNEFADRLEMWSSSAAVEKGLLDAVLYRDQVMDTLAMLSGRESQEENRLVSFSDYVKAPDTRRSKGYVRERIAVVYASGTIYMGDQLAGSIGSENLSKAIREAREDSSVKAVVLRVNSGGGDALASEIIWRELELTRGVKPVIASMGDVAASGGYYILAPADTIVASPVTITGSIGVFGLMVNAGDFLEDKLGITVDVEKTNSYSDFGSVYRPLSPLERNVMQHFVDETYESFVNHVAEGRDMAFEAVDRIGEGRVWSGINALDIGLVDMMGGLSDAIDIAAQMAGLDDYRIKELPAVEDPVTMIIRELTTGAREKFLGKELKNSYIHYKNLKEILGNDRIQARMPYDLMVY
ncbi:MAG: signal peptide peptidase SppA [Bacteroidales bacterium]|nr:signal peptide peptidase SppA [Bacteroidales bacterium]